MQEIAKNLDYYKVGTSNDFNSGCPVVSFGSYDAKDMGKTTVLATPKGERLQVQYAVVEADSVTTSNDKSGVANEKYNSSDPNIKRAIAGNGRMTAIATSYDAYPSKAEQYKQDLIANAGEHGCDPERIKGMKTPVLVRVMQPKDVTKDIGDQTNITQSLTLKAVEQTRTDVSRMKNTSFETCEDGSPTVESVKSFIAGLPRNEQAGLLTKEGKPTRTAQDRLQNAMIMKGYNNDYLVRMRGQAINPKGKNIINALYNASKASHLVFAISCLVPFSYQLLPGAPIKDLIVSVACLFHYLLTSSLKHSYQARIWLLQNILTNMPLLRSTTL